MTIIYFLSFLVNVSFVLGLQRYTPPPGLGVEKNREMAGVDDLVVYMQTAVSIISSD